MEYKKISFGRWFGSLVLFSLIVVLGIIWTEKSGVETKKIPAPEVASTTSPTAKKAVLLDVTFSGEVKSKTLSKTEFPVEGKAGENLLVSVGTYPTNTPFAKNAETHVKNFIEAFANDYPDRKSIVTSGGVSSESSVDFSHGKKLVSYLYSDYRDDGGAHGNVVYASETFDMNGKKYALADLFLPKTDYLGIISRMAIVHFVKDKNVNFDPKDTTFGGGLDPKLENFKTFVISGDKIIFQFQNYQIGPYTDGAQKFEISVADPEIKTIIRTELF